jgi:hypothetical protein
VTIEKISFLGVYIKFENLEILKMILEIMLVISNIYFFIRYIQYYSNDYKNFKEIDTLNNKKIGTFLKQKAEKVIKNIFPEFFFTHSDGFDKDETFYNGIKNNKWKIKISLDKENKDTRLIKIKKCKFMIPYLIAKITFSTNQLITDYYLPPILFLIAVGYYIKNKYHFFEKIALQLSNLNILILGTILLFMLLFVFYRRIKLELFT